MPVIQTGLQRRRWNYHGNYHWCWKAWKWCRLQNDTTQKLITQEFLTAGIATTIPVLVFAIVCISIADALAKPTYLAALSVHVSPARQGIVIGTAQALIAIADFISPVLGGFVLGYALYGVWIGIAISVAIIGLVTAMIYLSKSSVLIVKPETE